MARQRQRRRLLVIVRGMPGSGKSSLARRLTQNDQAIFSADDYYDVDEDGNFIDVRGQLHQAHQWNRRRVFAAVMRREPLIVVDNTNLQKWHMWPYVQMGFFYGYFIEFVATRDLPLEKLYERNEGRLSWETLDRMQERYERECGFFDVFYSLSCRRYWMKKSEGQDNYGWQ